MFALGALSFLSPWLLAALALVPVLWWLLRVTPPQPKIVRLPTFFLLKDIKSEIRTSARTPWWLLLIRALIVTCFILALADPVLRRNEDLPGRGGAVLMVIDNGWAAAAHWQDRIGKAREFLPQIARSHRSVTILTTAPAATDGKLHVAGPMDPAEAEQVLNQLQPMPWQNDHAGVAALLAPLHDISHALYFSDGLAAAATAALLDDLSAKAGGVTLVMDDKTNTPAILRAEGKTPGALALTIETLGTMPPADMSLVAYGAEGNILDTHKFKVKAGQTRAQVNWTMPDEIRGGVARVALAQPQMASAVFLTDSGWQQHPAGIIADPSRRGGQSFLNEVYYLKRALETGGTMAVDSVDALTKKNLSALIWPDSAALTAVERTALLAWVDAGGFLIRFAGPNLAANADDPLLPVVLRDGQRAMQGAMTWEKPVRLGTVAAQSPLFGLGIPEDVTIQRQVLAEPVPEAFEKTWLQLEDGTPLITGAKHGKGEIVLIHTTAGPDWSNFCYSGLYVESLQRMIALSSGIGDYKAETVSPPLQLMDGFGRLQPADAKSIAAPLDPKNSFTPSPVSPPGLYGDRRQYQAFNLGDALPQMNVLKDITSSVTRESYELHGEKSLRADFFRWSLWLLLADMIATLWLRGILAPRLKKTAAMVVFCLCLHVLPAAAQEIDPSDLSSGIYLAFVETGDQATDEVSYNGLSALKRIINLRTNIRVRDVRGVNPDVDALHFYPVLYWPMTASQGALSTTAARRLQDYLSQGGMIIFDTRDRQFDETSSSTPGTRQLRTVTKDIQIAELMPVEKGHILTKSFYLLDDFPGLYTGGKLWVEKEPSANYDAVTSVIIGGNDWASAWSDAPADRARFQPAGGEQQREMAYRFGVNAVMVALAGNYKADQVHVPYILERIGR